MYIKLPMHLFFYMAFGLNDFVGANALLGPLEGVGPEMVAQCVKGLLPR